MALTFAACNQKELCNDHWEHAPRYNYKLAITYDPQWQLTYEGGTDWRTEWDEKEYDRTYQSLLPSEPEGVAVLVYNTDRRYDRYNVAPDGGQIGISQGMHSLLLYNNDTECIVFNDLNTGAEATATTRTRTRSTYLGSPYRQQGREERTVNTPDMLYGCYIPEFEGLLSLDTTYIEAEMRPLVFRYLVRYHFDYGIQYVRIARGAMAGMAGSVYLTDGRTPEEAATVLYDIDVDCAAIKAKYEAQVEARAALKAPRHAPMEQYDEVGSGLITTVVNTFGAPGYPNPSYTRAPGNYGLNLEVRLGNGKILNYDFDITEQIRCQPRGGVIDVYGIVITDEDGKEASGAFDVNVDGWGEYNDVYIFGGSITGKN